MASLVEKAGKLCSAQSTAGVVVATLTNGLGDFNLPANPGTSAQQAEPDHPDQDEIDRYDNVQQPRNDEDQYAGEKRDDRLQMGDCHHGLTSEWDKPLKTAGGVKGSGCQAVIPGRREAANPESSPDHGRLFVPLDSGFAN
jgi:hypothetical protein